MAQIKEKDIVNYIVKHWDTYFPELKFCRTEYILRDFRVDIFACMNVNLKELGIRNDDYITNIPVFFEAKFDSNMRDLLCELNKQIQFRDFYINKGKCFCILCVLSDKYDGDMVKFMEDNDIIMYKYSFENDDLTTLKIKEYNSKTFIIEDDIEDKCLES